MDDRLTRRVQCFEGVWFDTFPISIWCQNNASFRTNNVAESFHAALSRRILHHHPQFYLFTRQVVQIINESKTILEEERLHPKERLRGAAVRRKINTLIENYNRGPPLALPLKTLMKAIYDALHEHVSFGDAFECEPDGAVDDTSEVEMDIIDE